MWLWNCPASWMWGILHSVSRQMPNWWKYVCFEVHQKGFDHHCQENQNAWKWKKYTFFNRSWKISWSLLHLWNQELYCIWVRILSQWESLYLPSKDENCLWRRCEVHHLSNTWRSWLSPSEWDPFPRYQALKHSFWSMWKCQDYRFWPI